MTMTDVSKLIRVNGAIQRQIDGRFESASQAYRLGDAEEGQRLYAEATALCKVLGQIQYLQTGVSLFAEL